MAKITILGEIPLLLRMFNIYTNYDGNKLVDRHYNIFTGIPNVTRPVHMLLER